MLVIMLSLLNILLFADDFQKLCDLMEYKNYAPRKVFTMCQKSGIDCTYFKAKIFESEGNAGSAMDLYLRGGYYDDYTRLQTCSGSDIEPILKKYKIEDKKASFYRGLSAYTRGDWKGAVDIFSGKELSDYLPAKFYLAYAYLMLGENDKAKKITEGRPSKLNFYDQLEYKKLDAFILYAENKQFEAKKLFMEVLASQPGDFISLKYLAHIYYRTGWFDKAEKIYASLISKEWRDTELYYLLSERAEMRVRYFKFDLAVKDADRIIKEYPGRKDFIALLSSWFLEHDNLQLAEKYSEKLADAKTPYENGLYMMSKGLLEEFKLNDRVALEYFEKANQFFPAVEYSDRIKMAESDLSSMDESRAPKMDCDKYKVQKLSNSAWHVESNVFGNTWPVNYFVQQKTAISYVMLKLRFVYSKEINFEERSNLWIKQAKAFWSSPELKLFIEKAPRASTEGGYTTINVVPWPSSFYSKRVSSHEWSVLTPPRTVDHEVGHLLGLDDEYYETDERIINRNQNRYIGPRTSIMRNMLSGRPEKRHIHFILSPIKCN